MTAAMKPHATGGVYLNFIGHEGSERIAAAFGDELRPAGADQEALRPGQRVPTWNHTSRRSARPVPA